MRQSRIGLDFAVRYRLQFTPGGSDAKHNQRQVVSPGIRSCAGFVHGLIVGHGITNQGVEVVRRLIEPDPQCFVDWFGEDVCILDFDAAKGLTDDFLHELVGRNHEIALLTKRFD